ncbi:MAG TPA: hypothetical protein VEA69_11545 [Tepidisphaeraceae bacterium]|nr:hypothetical protein [Tepidisphaeraceae bacterium]
MSDPTPAPLALHYARPVRPWARRLRRWWPVGLLVLVAVLAVAYGPHARRHYQLMRLQAACLSADLPQDRPVYEEDPAAAAALAAERPADYTLDVGDQAARAVRVDPRWAALAAEAGMGPVPYVLLGWTQPTTFCHERFTPAGRRRLVVVEGWRRSARATVVEPSGWTGGRPRVAWRGMPEWDRTTEDALGSTNYLPGSLRVGAGTPDPADRSRWTAPFVFCGVPGTFEYQLADDDTVTVRLLDPAGFMAKAAAVMLGAPEAAKAGAEEGRPPAR